MPEVTTIETLSSASAEPKLSTAKEKTFSLARRITATVAASQLLLVLGIFLAVALGEKTQSPVDAGLAGLGVLLAAIWFARWGIRRELRPVRELSERLWNASPQNLSFAAKGSNGLPEELSPVVLALENLQARIRTTARQQRDFTSDSAHELKTSVAIIKSSLQSLRQRPRSQREYELGLEDLLGDCSRLEDLLKKMLRLARIEQAAETDVPRDLPMTDVKTTCQAALSRIVKLAAERVVTLELEAPDSVQLRADPEDLELIWMNLLENAVQFSPSHSVVTMRLQSGGTSGVEISVLDSGPGIPTVELPYIFERFHRGDPSPAGAPARTPGGFGLGLAICKALVESYGGTIEATNLPEIGAELRVRLPLGTMQAAGRPNGSERAVTLGVS